ncbi:MAG: calcium/sodium antiporter [Planctomycetota bacterium]|jgi:cation:H+ antiporter
MNIFWAIILLVAGLAILLKGADWLVDGAVALAERFGISALVIGLTIVAMGTSAPEVATSITAAARGLGNIAISNVYGSNIANLALVGGLCALISPIGVQLRTIKLEMPVMFLVALLLWPVLANLYLGRAEGAGLLVLFAGLLICTVYMAMREAKSSPAEDEQVREHIHDKKPRAEKPVRTSIFLIVLGLAGLALGAHLAIIGGVRIGEKAGLSETVIGLTIIAIGTSLPELMTCLVAAFKGHDEISIGTLIGSNIFNALLAVGCAGLIRPFELSGRLIGVDYWVMVGISLAFILMAISGKVINRLEGLLLTCSYAGYIVYILIFTRTI